MHKSIIALTSAMLLGAAFVVFMVLAQPQLVGYLILRAELEVEESAPFDFNVSSSFIEDMPLPSHDVEGDLHLYHRSPLVSFGAQDIEHICFETQKPDSLWSEFTAHFFFTEAARTRLASALQSAGQTQVAIMHKNEAVGSAFGIGGDILLSTKSIAAFARQNAQPDNTGRFEIGRHSDISFASRGANEVELLRFVKTFSPSKIPAGCNANFNPEEVMWWKFTETEIWADIPSEEAPTSK